jgi:hypothetical protein
LSDIDVVSEIRHAALRERSLVAGMTLLGLGVTGLAGYGLRRRK